MVSGAKNNMTKASEADRAILIEAIASAAVAHAGSGNEEAARHITQFASTVLNPSERIAKAWAAGEWEWAEASAASEAIWAVRVCAA